MENKDYKLILSNNNDNGTCIALLANDNNFVVAYDYNAETNGWNQGHYFMKYDDYKMGNALTNALNKFNEYFDERIKLINNFENMGLSHEDIEDLRKLINKHSDSVSLNCIDNINYLHRLHYDFNEYIYNEAHKLDVDDIKNQTSKINDNGIHYDTLYDYLKDVEDIDVSDKDFDFLMNCYYIENPTDEYDKFLINLYKNTNIVKIAHGNYNAQADFTGFIKDNKENLKKFADEYLLNSYTQDFSNVDDFCEAWLDTLQKMNNGNTSENIYKAFNSVVFKNNNEKERV